MSAIALVGSSGAPLPNVASRLLETKLYVPRSRSALVARPRLVDQLAGGADRKLTLVVAPAGFGKTTLLAAWLAGAAGGERSAAWVSLDPSENEPARFWSYVVRALQKALQPTYPDFGAQALLQLQSPHPPPIEHVLTALINEIDALDADTLLVLDDYHVIDAAPVHEALALLLDRLPPRMRVVIASRAEPPLPLARLRARGELVELRATDLRFTEHEATAYLNQVMALALSPADTATLERRTEGWITGLKLAALSMQRRGDTRGFVDAFSGDDRYIADFLVDEILSAESERTRRFLLGTAMLERLSAPLCDAVLETTDSERALEGLERRGLFVVALDDRREWFRYHHLFADVLQKHALRDDPERVRAGHRRASAWYEQAGALEDAVRHALGAGEADRAAAMLEGAWPGNDRSYESARWLERVRALPEPVLDARPVLGMGYAWALLNAGELEAAEERLRHVERWLAAVPDGAMAPDTASGAMRVTDEEKFRSLHTELAKARVYLSRSRGEIPGSVEQARRALELLPEGDLASRATGTALLALAHWAIGELERAYRTFDDALALMRASGHALDAVRGTFVLGDIRVAQGRLREAGEIYEHGLRLAADEGSPEVTETDELHLGLSELRREWGDVDGALDLLNTLAASAGQAAYAGNRHRWCTAMARVREAQGDLAGALALLDEAGTHDLRSPIPRWRPIAAMAARIRIAQGRVAEAAEWVRQSGLTADDALGYMREYEHLTLARVLIAREEAGGQPLAAQGALRLLDRVRTAAEEGARTGTVIEALLLESVARRALGDVRGAMPPLGRALVLAEPEGYQRLFLDEGNRMRDLLRHATTRGLGGEYARRLLSAFEAPARSRASSPAPHRAAGVASSAMPGGEGDPDTGAVGAPLTPRELEILRLIAGGMRNREIAAHLDITPATVKRHVANVYGKLGARHRTEAMLRAKALRVL